MEDDTRKLVGVCKSFLEEPDKEAEAREQLENAVAKFKSEEMSRISASGKQKTYAKKGAETPMIYLHRCERIGREVYFIDYEMAGTSIPDACLEASRIAPRCPFARDCGHYKKDAIGRKMSGCVNVVKD